MSSEKGFSTLQVLVSLAALSIIAVLGVGMFRVGPPPTIRITPELPAVGRRTPVQVEVAEPVRGLSKITVEFIQGDLRQVLAEREHTPRSPLSLWGARTASDELKVDVGRDTIQGMKSSIASVRVTAERAGSWLRSPDPKIEEIALPVRLTPPSLQVNSIQTYVAQGGCEAVVYRVGESSVRDGVRSGEWWFPGYPLPGGSDRDRFALFAVPYDLTDTSKVRLVAVDDAGNEAERTFIDRFFAKPFKTDTITVGDAFMAKVVPEIMAESPDMSDKGSMLDNYLAINGDLRRKNAQTLKDLAGESSPEFLWRDAFLMLPNGKVMSAFADRRTYVYEGKVVDHQDHLGFDLAALRQTPVPASNRGIVRVAKYFGIYGISVVIDHGYGLMSLYGHLSSLNVSEGQAVERGDIVGRTGETGLAGGDHLHFTMLLQGLPVNPVEWWDGHWIRDRLGRKLGAALPLGNAGETSGDSSSR